MMVVIRDAPPLARMPFYRVMEFLNVSEGCYDTTEHDIYDAGSRMWRYGKGITQVLHGTWKAFDDFCGDTSMIPSG